MPQRELPEWLSVLQQAGDRKSWLQAIGDAHPAATLGLLRRYELPEVELPSERVREVEAALDAKRLTLTDLGAWRDDVLVAEAAVESIEEFQQAQPLAQDFRIEHGLPGGTLDNIKDSVREAIWSEELQLRDWVEFLDDRRDQLHRHLFLYRIPQEQLVTLASEQGLHDRLRELGRGDLVDEPEFVWRTDSPRLVAASRDASGEILTLRWVGWRRRLVGDANAPDGQRVEERRCVVFARLGLESGELELQLPRRYWGGMQGLLAERSLYTKAVTDVLGFRPDRLLLEAPMRALMKDRRVALDRWRVRLPKGGELAGRNQPGLFDNVTMIFKRYYALELAGDWSVSKGESVPLRMDARTDALSVFWQCEPTALADLIAAVQRRAEAVSGEPPEPEKSTVKPKSEIAELRELLEKLLRYQRRLGRRTIPVDDLAAEGARHDLHFTRDTLHEALNKIGVAYLGAGLYVVSPETGEPIAQEGEIVEFGRLRDVPSRHRVEGAIWIRLDQVAPLGAPPPKKDWRVLVVFCVGYVVLVTLATWAFVELLDSYREPYLRAFLTVGYLVVLLGPLAGLYEKVGTEPFEAATRFVKDIPRVLRGFLARLS